MQPLQMASFQLAVKVLSHFVAWYVFPLLISNTALCECNSLTTHQLKDMLIAFHFFRSYVNNAAVEHSVQVLVWTEVFNSSG